MAAASTVKVTFLGDADSLARAARMAQGQIDKVSSSVGRATKIGSFFGSAAGNLAASGLGKIQSFATGSVDAFAAVEDATSAAGVQFGEQLPIITKFADEAAKNFGMSRQAALEASNTFGTMGKVAGLTGTDLSGFSTQLTGLAGDLASFKGTSTEQAIGAVGAALRGETEPIRAYGVMLDQAAIEAEALAMGLAKPVANMADISAAQTRAMLAQKAYNTAVKDHGPASDQAARAELTLGTATRALAKATEGKVPKLTAANKVLAAQSLILKQTTDAQGDYGNTSTSTANTQKTLQAETQNAQAALGQQLAPALTAVRQLMLKGIKAVSGFAAGIAAAGEFVGENATTFKVLAGIAAAVVVPALAAMTVQWVLSGTKATVSAAKQAFAWLTLQGSSNKAGAAVMKNFALMIAGWARSTAVAIASAAKATAAVVASAAVQIANWIRMGAVAMAQAARMAAAWVISMGPIAIAVAAVVGAVALIIKNWDKIKAATAKAWGFVKDAVQKAVGFMVTVLTNFTGPGLVIKHWDTIMATIRAVPGKLKSLVADFVRLGVDMIAGFIQGCIDKAKDIPGVVTDIGKNAVKSLWDTIKPGSPSRVTRPLGQSFSEGLAAGITDKAKKVREATQAMVDKLKDRLKEVRDFAADIRSQFRDVGNVTSIDTMVTDAAGEQREGGFAAMLDGLRKRAADAQRFASAMAQLRKQGLNATSLEQLREAGPEGGLAAAQNLLGGGMGGIGEVNRLMAQINRVGTAFAATEARARYGIGPDAKLTNRDVKVILDTRGGEDEFKRWIRKWVRAEGGNVQKVLGAL